MHVTITKCLDCWFSVDVATSMLVDKRKSVIFFLKESCQVVLFFLSYYVTIHMKPFWQYFHMVLFVFQHFTE